MMPPTPMIGSFTGQRNAQLVDDGIRHRQERRAGQATRLLGVRQAFDADARDAWCWWR
jgi:hypothetical protein